MSSKNNASSKTSTTIDKKTRDAFINSRAQFIDEIFPLYDQIMYSIKFPEWFSSLASIFLSFQILSIEFWIYAPPFANCTGKWRNTYITISKIFCFQNPVDFSGPHRTIAYLSLAIALFSIVWLRFVIFYSKRYYVVPHFMLNLTAIILEVLTPIFLVPSAFVVAHSIAALHEKSDKLLVGGLCIGLLSYIIILGMFIIGILLKSRSVVLTNLTFQVYDPPTVLVFFVTTTVCVILTALFKFFDSWFYVVMLFVHLFVAFMNCYRNLYMPFYTLFRNPTSFTFGVVTTALDIYLMIQYFKPSIPYYPTVYIFLVTLVVSSVVCKRIFLKLIDKTKQNLQKQDGITNYDDYFDEIGVCKNSLTVMKYIVVGLAEYCPLFYDGHLTDYIISHTKDEKSLSLCLQILTYFPCESHKMNILYKKLMTKKKLSFINRFLIYQISEIKTRRLVSNSKDTLELSNKLHMMNNSCKYGYQQFWDKSNCPTSFLVNLSNTVLINNPNNVKIANEYANFLAECLCDFNSSIYYAMKADAIVDGNNFNVDVSFRSLAQEIPKIFEG